MTTRRRKLLPELDLPEQVAAVFTQYLGARRLAKLSAEQRTRLMQLAQGVGTAVGQILDDALSRLPRIENRAESGE